jgi:hypothetical protein
MTTRQARIAIPMTPRIAPTMMKMEPSGRVDFCMNGAFAVSGTIWVTGPTPAIVGSEPVKLNCERVFVVVMEGALVMLMLLPAAEDPVLVGAAELELGEFVLEPWELDWVLSEDCVVVGWLSDVD